MSGDRARDVYRELQRLARADYGGATGQLLVVYGVEGFLRRLAASAHATRMTLKGGMLMAATATRRMTKDADLSTVGVPNDPEQHRDRDFADVWTLSRTLALSAATVRTAIVEVAEHRGHDVVPLSEALAEMPDRQTSYAAMLSRMAYQRPLPQSWRDLLAYVRDFVDPLVTDADHGLTTWDPVHRVWRED